MKLTDYQIARVIYGGCWAYSTSGYAGGWHPITPYIFTKYNQPGMRPSFITATERHHPDDTLATRIVLALSLISAVWVGAVAVPL